MLHVINSILPKSSSLEIDDYVPISFHCQYTKREVPLYWRTGDFKQSLMEIGLDPKNGAISSITVPFFGTGEKKDISWEEPSVDRTQGVPICNIQEWTSSESFSDRFKKEPSPFKTIIGTDFVSFWLGQETPLHSVYEFGQLCLGVDKESRVVSISFHTLSKEDLRNILRT